MPELHERDDDYVLAYEVMTIEFKTTSEKQYNLRYQYFNPACPFSRNLINSILSKKHYVGLSRLCRFYFDCKISLVKLYWAIRLKSFPYVARYNANNTNKRTQFKRDDI